MPVTQVYEALQRGTTDAVFLPFEAVQSFKFGELVKYHLQVPGGLYAGPFFIPMNKQRWDGLPGWAKDAFTAKGGAFAAEMIGRVWARKDDESEAFVKSIGNKVNMLSDAEAERWAEVLKPVRVGYIARGKAHADNAAELMDDLLKMMFES